MKELLEVLQAKCKDRKNKENSQVDFKNNMMKDYNQKLAILQEKAKAKSNNDASGITSSYKENNVSKDINNDSAKPKDVNSTKMDNNSKMPSRESSIDKNSRVNTESSIDKKGVAINQNDVKKNVLNVNNNNTTVDKNKKLPPTTNVKGKVSNVKKK